MVSIEGLNKADVLAALYNASRPLGRGFIAAGVHGAEDMDRHEAEEALYSRKHAAGLHESPFAFDYLHGRPLKVDLWGTDEFDPQGYDSRNGGDGAAQRVVDYLRATGLVTRADGTSFSTEEMTIEESDLFMLGMFHNFV